MKKLQRIGQFDLTPCNLAKLIFCQVGRLFHKTETVWYYLEKKLTTLFSHPVYEKITEDWTV